MVVKSELTISYQYLFSGLWIILPVFGQAVQFFWRSKMPDTSHVYHPRKPQESQYCRCIEDNFENLEQVYDVRFAKQHGFFRPYVRHVIYRFLDCGIPTSMCCVHTAVFTEKACSGLPWRDLLVRNLQPDIWNTERSVVDFEDNQVWARGSPSLYHKDPGGDLPRQGRDPRQAQGLQDTPLKGKNHGRPG